MGARERGRTTIIRSPLIGERTVAGLSRIIAKTMPEDEPGTASARTPTRSPPISMRRSTRRRRRPAIRSGRRGSSCRGITVRQYRNAVADLVGSFRGPGRWDDAAGSRASMRGAAGGRRRAARGNDGFSRVDPEVRFHFGSDSPIPAQNAVEGACPSRYVPLPALRSPSTSFRQFSQEFRVNWQGSVLAPETGEYEFVVRSENAIRLWVNDNSKPLIDISVKSGNDTEYRETIYLLGGRVYPLRLEF